MGLLLPHGHLPRTCTLHFTIIPVCPSSPEHGMISRDVALDQTNNFTNALSTQEGSSLSTDVPVSQTQGVVSGAPPELSRGECPKALTPKPVRTSGSTGDPSSCHNRSKSQGKPRGSSKEVGRTARKQEEEGWSYGETHNHGDTPCYFSRWTSFPLWSQLALHTDFYLRAFPE